MPRRRSAKSAGEPAQSVLVQESELARVRGVLALGGVPWDEIEDGVQHVRLKLLEQQADPKRPEISNTAAWTSVVASRVAVDWHRARARDAGLRDRLAQRWSSRHPSSQQEDDRVLALSVAEGLDRLPATQRQVLVLRFYEDMTVPEIGRVLNVPEGTVKSRLHGAIAAIRTRLSAMEVS